MSSLLNPSISKRSSTKIISVSKEGGDLVEVRTDLLTFEEAKKIHSPILLTVKGNTLDPWLELKPALIDLPYDAPHNWIERCAKVAPLILSYHDFEKTPEDLDALLKKMQHPKATYYKIACMANSGADAIRLAALGKKEENVIAIAMGEIGQWTRLLAHPFTYAAVDEKNAPGQLTLEEMQNIYHLHRKVNPPLYGLLGNPVAQSRGHIFHNRIDKPMLYVKIALTAEELPLLFSVVDLLEFKGFSVTMPLKEEVLPFIENPEGYPAVNTLRKDEKWVGTNTDGKATLDLIGDVKEKRVLILGAGGAAKGIAFEAQKRGAHVLCYNRTKEKARALGEAVNSPDVPCDYAINTIPLPTKAPYDIVRANGSSFAEEMFIKQAELQWEFWGMA